jgi:glucose-6-phosphate 1-dehydrogenase
MPALYNLVRANKLPDQFAIIGVDHNGETTQAWRQNLTETMQAFARGREGKGDAIDERAWSWLVGRMHYMAPAIAAGIFSRRPRHRPHSRSTDEMLTEN